MSDYSRLESGYLREPDPPADYCDDCAGWPCVCDQATDAARDEDEVA